MLNCLPTILAMSDAVQLALIAALTTGVPATIAAISGLVVVLRRLKTIEKQTNGNFTRLSDHNEQLQCTLRKVETIAPGITTIPPGMEAKTTLEINDPTNNDPALVIQKATRSTP